MSEGNWPVDTANSVSLAARRNSSSPKRSVLKNADTTPQQNSVPSLAPGFAADGSTKIELAFESAAVMLLLMRACPTQI